MDRRTFLKITGLGSAAVAAGCTSNPEKNLFALVHAPDDMVSGQATWYASTCRECPAGCGVLAKNREGRVIKLEGNPLNPVNRGKLCVRGQAALQGLYNPDRLTTCLRKTDNGLEPVSFPEAENLVRQHLERSAAKGPDGVAMVTEVTGDTLLDLFRSVLSQYGSGQLRIYEPFAFESLKYAHQQVYGKACLPGFRMDRSDLLIGFGADFLETWLSPVEYARQFKTMHAVDRGKKGFFAHVSPYQSLTGLNADQWLACRPGSELSVALLLLNQMIQSGKARRLSADFKSGIEALTSAYTFESVSAVTGIAAGDLERLAQRVRSASRPLLLGSGSACQGPMDAALDLAVVILNTLDDPTLSLIDFDQRHRVEIADSRLVMETFWGRCLDSPPGLLMLHNVNPLYSASPQSKVAGALGAKETFVVAFSCYMDETAAAADLIIPIQHPLESWDVYESKQATKAIVQPVLGKFTPVAAIGDFFLKLMPEGQQPSGDYRKYMIRQLVDQGLVGSEDDWIKMMQDGGRFVADRQVSKPVLKLDRKLAADLTHRVQAVAAPDPETFNIYLAPSLRFMDGRGANRPWLSEIPDPVSLVSWQTLAWVHPDVMAANHWVDGGRVDIKTDHGEIQLPVVAYGGLDAKAIVIPMGQGHAPLRPLCPGPGGQPRKTDGSGNRAPIRCPGVPRGGPIHFRGRQAANSGLRFGQQGPAPSQDRFDRFPEIDLGTGGDGQGAYHERFSVHVATSPGV